MSAAVLRGALQDARGRALRALEANRDGDRELVDHVLDDLIVDVDRVLQSRKKVVCSDCGLAFAWPGELQAHRLTAHDEAPA